MTEIKDAERRARIKKRKADAYESVKTHMPEFNQLMKAFHKKGMIDGYCDLTHVETPDGTWGNVAKQTKPEYSDGLNVCHRCGRAYNPPFVCACDKW